MLVDRLPAGRVQRRRKGDDRLAGAERLAAACRTIRPTRWPTIRRRRHFGATLFFDTAPQRQCAVSCSTCHLIDRQFQDDLPLAKGIGITNRRTMPLAGDAWSPWFFWDGRRDSLWAQALAPMENAVEQAATARLIAHFISASFHDRYERIFGPLPDLSRRAGKCRAVRQRRREGRVGRDDGCPARDAVDRVFANIGKSDRERSNAPSRQEETRFDRFAAALAAGKQPQGDAAFSSEEMLGLKLFIGKANCVDLPQWRALHRQSFPQHRRAGVARIAGGSRPRDAVKEVAADPFNCLGKFSDSRTWRLRRTSLHGDGRRGAERAPTRRRRCAGRPTGRPTCMPGRSRRWRRCSTIMPRRRPRAGGTSEVHPVTLSERERGALIAFLRTLSE